MTTLSAPSHLQGRAYCGGPTISCCRCGDPGAASRWEGTGRDGTGRDVDVDVDVEKENVR